MADMNKVKRRWITWPTSRHCASFIWQLSFGHHFSRIQYLSDATNSNVLCHSILCKFTSNSFDIHGPTALQLLCIVKFYLPTKPLLFMLLLLWLLLLYLHWRCRDYSAVEPGASAQKNTRAAKLIYKLNVWNHKCLLSFSVNGNFMQSNKSLDKCHKLQLNKFHLNPCF